MKVLLSFSTFCLLAAGCSRHHGSGAMEHYFEKEIASRIAVIRSLPDSANINVLQVDRQVNNLVLLSKDVENLQAVLNHANTYFSTLAGRYHMNPADFTKLETAMPAGDIVSALKQNELDFFNQVIFHARPADGATMYTAH